MLNVLSLSLPCAEQQKLNGNLLVVLSKFELVLSVALNGLLVPSFFIELVALLFYFISLGTPM